MPSISRNGEKMPEPILTPGDVAPPTPSWMPSKEKVDHAQITEFARWAHKNQGAPQGDYHALWRWSTQEPSMFWSAVWDYFGLSSPTPFSEILTGSMPDARWFEGAEVNYVERVAAQARPGCPAILDIVESADLEIRTITWDELLRQVAALRQTLQSLGVKSGDRVVGYLPNCPEGVIGFLATASLGAVWAACGQDYASAAAASRLAQLEPVVLLTADGYFYAGRRQDRTAAVAELRSELDSLRAVVMVSRIDARQQDDVIPWDTATAGSPELEFTHVPFAHPLWVLFSSGTTGTPKGIVHGHGGVLLEHLKACGLQMDLGPDDVFFWYTTPSWMVWNFLVSGLLVGSTIVTYDGSPAHLQQGALWRISGELGVTCLGTSPAYLLTCEKEGVEPAKQFNLSALKCVGSSGSPLPPTSYKWLAEHVGPDVQLVSSSGGTDIVSAFAGGSPDLPVWPGELSGPWLGVALDAWDSDGNSVRNSVGELVVTAPMPSMPLGLWGDEDGSRYREAYFSTYPGVWRHGDWITITDRGSVKVHGRSDSTLNRRGIRMGTADIYAVVESMPMIEEALMLGVEQSDGGYWMPLFLQLSSGVQLDDTLRVEIESAIRREVSPMHVPDEILQAPAIPHTRTGKKLEVPIKRLFAGGSAPVVDETAIDSRQAWHWFVDLSNARAIRGGNQ